MKINKHIQNIDYPEYTNRSLKNVKVNLAQHKGRIEEYNYMISQEKELIRRIAMLEHLKEENVLLTAGADAALHHIAEAFLDSGKIAVIPVPSFGRFEFHAKVVDAKVVFVQHSKFPYSFDLKQIEKITRKTKATVIFLANPNNPTGELIDKKRLERFVKDNKDCLVVIDEVLVDDVENSMSEFVTVYSNFVIVKSFSKLLGIPGLRVGYIIAHPSLPKIIGKTVSPYEVSSVSLQIAKRLLADKTYIFKRKKEFREARDLLKRKIALPLSNTEASVGLIDGGERVSLFDYLQKHDILTVDGKNFRGLEKTNTVRITINSKEDIERLIAVVNKYKSNI